MKKEVIHALRERAWLMAMHVAKNIPGHNNDWNERFVDYSVSATDGLHHEILNNGLMFWPKKRNNRAALIIFRTITAIEPDREKFHAPVLLKGDVVNAQSTTVVNKSHNVSVDRTYSFDVSEETTFQEDVGVELTTHITQTIKVGGEATLASSTTEFGLSVSASYNKSTSASNAQSSTTETSITVPPRTKATVSTERSISKFRQKLEYWGDLTHSVKLHANDDYSLQWDTMDSFKRTLKGEAARGTPLYEQYKKGDLHEWFVNVMTRSIDVHYEIEVKFDKAVAGNVVVSDESLDK